MSVELKEISNIDNNRTLLRDFVIKALEDYFANLDGHNPANLYNLVLEEVESPLFSTVLTYTNNNQSKAAKILGINRNTLRKKLKLYGLE